MPMDPALRPPFHQNYTIGLFVMAGLAAMMVFSHQMIIGLMAHEEGADVIRIVLRCLQGIEALITVFGLTVGCLRAYRSPLAAPLTAALSILLVMWVPFGTGMFLWWVLRVRHRERGASGSPIGKNIGAG